MYSPSLASWKVVLVWFPFYLWTSWKHLFYGFNIHLFPGGKEPRAFLKRSVEGGHLWLPKCNAKAKSKMPMPRPRLYLDWVRFELQGEKVPRWSDLKIRFGENQKIAPVGESKKNHLDVRLVFPTKLVQLRPVCVSHEDGVVLATFVLLQLENEFLKSQFKHNQ